MMHAGCKSLFFLTLHAHSPRIVDWGRTCRSVMSNWMYFTTTYWFNNGIRYFGAHFTCCLLLPKCMDRKPRLSGAWIPISSLHSRFQISRILRTRPIFMRYCHSMLMPASRTTEHNPSWLYLNRFYDCVTFKDCASSATLLAMVRRQMYYYPHANEVTIKNSSPNDWCSKN